MNLPAKKPIIGFRVDISIEPDDDGFHAFCPALKGLHTSGNTKEEALDNARNAAIAYIESLIKHGDPIPVGLVIREENKDKTPKNGPSCFTEDLQVAFTT